MEEIKAYKPKCCNKAYITKSGARKHEHNCYKNSDNRACLTCGNFITDYNTIYVPPHGDQNYGDEDYEERYNYCDYDNKVISTEYLQSNKPFQYHCPRWIPKAGD